MKGTWAQLTHPESFLFLLVYRKLLFLLSLSRNGTFFYSVYSDRMAFSSFNNDTVQVSSCVLELASRYLHMLTSKGSLLLSSLFTQNQGMPSVISKCCTLIQTSYPGVVADWKPFYLCIESINVEVSVLRDLRQIPIGHLLLYSS